MSRDDAPVSSGAPNPDRWDDVASCPCSTERCREDAMVVIERDETDRPTVWCDPCIVPLVSALNDGGMPTVASCCGHGAFATSVALRDGRWLVLCPSQPSDDVLAMLGGADLLPAGDVSWIAVNTDDTCPELHRDGEPRAMFADLDEAREVAKVLNRPHAAQAAAAVRIASALAERDAAVSRADALAAVLRPFIDDETCSFDHHGYCQVHGSFNEGPCHMVAARAALAETDGDQP